MAGPRDGSSRRLGQPTARDTLNTTDTGQAKVTTRITDPANSVAFDVGDLLTVWVGIQMDTVDSLVADAQAKVDALPDYRTLMMLVGELTVRSAWLETEVASLRAEVAQLRQGRRAA
jgi:uncharacterized small protein (DUF1192 family)